MTKKRLFCVMTTIVFFVFSAYDCSAAESAEKQKRSLQIGQLVLQRKILDAMKLYEDFSKTSLEHEKKFFEFLGDTPYFEAIKLFESGQTPSGLNAARSEWRNWNSIETHRWGLRIWLDNCASKDELVQLELKIKEIDTQIKIGGVLTKEDREEIARLRLIATEINVPDARPLSLADRMESESKASEWMKKRASNYKKEETE